MPILVIGLATLLRMAASLDAAPFGLYLPLVFLIALALGRTSGAVALATAIPLAAFFFAREEGDWQLSGDETTALVQALVVGIIMVMICGSLRQAFVDNEVALARLDEANQILRTSGEHLEAARRQAEEAQEAAEAANRAKSEFLANMSHELRTPLSAIIGYSEMVLEEIEESSDEAGLATDIRKIEGNARHLLGLINDVLDLSKIEAGKMDVYAEAFALEPMLREVAATVDSLVDKKGNRLILHLQPELGSAYSDTTKIRQILLNFLSNAAKFTERGEITLSGRRSVAEDGSETITLSVADTGIGMTPDQVDKLFRRFQQADSSTTRKYGGTGLGLSLTKAFADMLGGTVSVASVSGKGSTFTLTLPARYVPPAIEEASAEPDVITEEDDGRDLILVIDDDPDQRAIITRFLHREGFRVQVATNGRSGLDLARKSPPRAILLDVMMPGIDGWSVLSEIKTIPQLAETPVVMVTAVDQRNLAASLGASDYMMKPVDWTRFRRVVDRFRSTDAGGRGHVLLVEDDAIIRTSMRATLEDAGWSVVEAGNGREGLEQASAMPPQVVLVDLNMPVMDGFRFLTELRAVPGCATVPVVILTGRELSIEDRRMLRGASQILNRGDLSLTALVDKLHHLADQQRT